MIKNNDFSTLTFIHCIVIFTTMSFSSAANEMNLETCLEKYSNTELSVCLDTVKQKAEKELVIWVNNQTFILDTIKKETGRGSALNVFTRSMTRFKSYREDNCRWQYLSISPAKGANIAYKKCYIELTQTKINELAKLSQ